MTKSAAIRQKLICIRRAGGGVSVAITTEQTKSTIPAHGMVFIFN